MKNALVITALLISSISFADIRRPHGVDTRTIAGKEALSLWNKLNVSEQLGSSLRTSSSTFKISRNADGLKQIICEKTVYRLIEKKTEIRCTIETSTDGQQLPVFRIPIRMG